MKILNPANSAAGALPIRETDSLREALAYADVPTLLMVYTQISGDADALDHFAPHIRPQTQGGTQIPEDLQIALREKLFALLTQDPPPSFSPLSDGLMRRMMDVYTGEHVAEEFVPLLLEQSGMTGVQGVDLSSRAKPPEGFKVLVIGSGLSGIALGVKLSEAGYNYEIIERNDEVGGTWYHTRYPGLAVDTPSHFYSYSFELNASWTHWFSRGKENHEYLVHTAAKYGVRDRVTFRHEVVSAVWDEADAKWDVTVRDLESGAETVRRVDVFISAIGFNNRPKSVDIPGHETFKGISMHAAKWDQGIDLSGLRIGVVGTGCSSMQISPIMADTGQHLTIFQRSRHWVMPIPILNQEIPDQLKWALHRIPHYSQWWRLITYWNASDGLYQNVVMDPDWHMPEVSTCQSNEMVRQYLLSHIETHLSDRPDLKDKVVPDYPPGGKRFIMDNDWFQMLKRDDVTLETAGIDRVVENGILTKDGRMIELDAIIYATGYVLADMLAPMHIAGRDGVTIRQLWGSEDPRAHRGLTVPKFPNFFVMSGPGSAPNHGAGVNILAEQQTNMILGCLDLMLNSGARQIEPKQEHFENYNEAADAQLKNMVWAHPRVKSYYQNSKGRLYLSSPWRLVDSWHQSRRPDPAEYDLR